VKSAIATVVLTSAIKLAKVIRVVLKKKIILTKFYANPKSKLEKRCCSLEVR
jgi:hypothetical protein